MIGLLIVALCFASTFLYFNKMYRLVEIQIIYTICNGILVYNLGAPRLSFYLCDWINIIMLLHIIKRMTSQSENNQYKICIRSKCIFTGTFVIIFLLIGIISAFVNFSGFKSLLMLLWGLRNYGRFFVFFVSFVYYMRQERLGHLFKIMRYLLYISTVLSLYQYYILGFGMTGNSGDLIGGIFGTATSGNAALCLFMLGMCAYYINLFLNKHISFFNVASVIVCSLVSAALGEIKFFFIIFVVVGAIIIIINRPSLKTSLLTMLGVLTLVFMVSYMQSNYESYEVNIFSYEGIIHYTTESSYSYTSSSINRIGGIATINRLIFDGKPSLIGVGLGNADYSSFFSSDIYDKWGHTNYTWFIIPFLYLETGLLGLIAYAGIYAGLLIDTIRNRMSGRIAKKTVISLSIASLIIMTYNSSLRVDAAYVYFAFLAVPFMNCESDSESLEREN